MKIPVVSRKRAEQAETRAAELQERYLELERLHITRVRVLTLRVDIGDFEQAVRRLIGAAQVESQIDNSGVVKIAVYGRRPASSSEATKLVSYLTERIEVAE